MEFLEIFADPLFLDAGHPPTFTPHCIIDVNRLSGRRKRRVVYAPNQAMRVLHTRLRAYLRHLPLPLPYATGCRPGNSADRNVALHAGRRHLVLLDISNAYGRVDVARLARVLCTTDPRLSKERATVEAVLRSSCFAPGGGLATGTPAAQDLFNTYVGVLVDATLGPWCDERDITYTRYLDDLTFSSHTPIGEKKRRAIRAMLTAAGLPVNDKKAQVIDLVKGPAVVNGIGINIYGKRFIARKELTSIRGMIAVAISFLRQHCALSPSDPTWTLISRIHGKMGIVKRITPPMPDRQSGLERDLLKSYYLMRFLERRRRDAMGRRAKAA